MYSLLFVIIGSVIVVGIILFQINVVFLILYANQLTIFEFLVLIALVSQSVFPVSVMSVALDDGTQIGIAIVDVLGHLYLCSIVFQNTDIQTQGLKLF